MQPPAEPRLVEAWPDPPFDPASVLPGLPAQVMAISAGRVAELTAAGVRSAIRKSILSSLANPQAIEITDDGVAGDEQADRRVHGGMQKAVYLYPAEYYNFWATFRAQAHQTTPLAPGGALGENLTIRGFNEHSVYVGDILRMGSVILRVTKQRSPCFKFNLLMGSAHASKLMNQSGFTGWYAMVIQPGKVAAGDAITIEAGSRIVTINDMHRTQQSGSQGNLF
jgi:MOSC domain-containing protein YiiM